MANIVRRDAQQNQVGTARGEWDPFQLMRDMLRVDPYRELTPFSERHARYTFSPSFDVKETDKAYVFKADLPGLSESDIEISATGNRLTVSGKREVDERNEGETYYTYERSFGSFTRVFTLPDGVDADHVQADLKNGVLTLNLPKSPELQPKRIQIQGLSPKHSAHA